MRLRRDTTPMPVPTPNGATTRADLEEIASEMIAESRRSEAVKELRGRVEQLRQEEAARTAGATHCAYCGTRVSPSWTQRRLGIACSECDWDISDHPSDVEHRSLIVNLLATGKRSFHMNEIAENESRACGFRWFVETPGAKTGLRRFDYIGLDALKAAYVAFHAPPAPALPTFRTGEPCEKCGTKYMWTVVQRRIPTGRAEELACAGCGKLVDIVDLGTKLLGLSYPGVEAAQRLQLFGFYEDLPANDARRKQVNAPWAYLGDLAALRRNIFSHLQDREHWSTPNAYERIKNDYLAHGGTLAPKIYESRVPWGDHLIVDAADIVQRRV